ncbi:Uncharacterised protein [Raoultella planticola]|uniref:Uncharacterized protein n=1 Tax=Raoultella planticola TaxID=575 RepID=A0A485CSV5_RAOPL|nr:Uncharacterised protein [Raoultella planticola]
MLLVVLNSFLTNVIGLLTKNIAIFMGMATGIKKHNQKQFRHPILNFQYLKSGVLI